METQAEQALNLHNSLSEMYWKEANTKLGTRKPDAVRLARLDLLKQKAANRWRRIMGYQPRELTKGA